MFPILRCITPLYNSISLKKHTFISDSFCVRSLGNNLTVSSVPCLDLHSRCQLGLASHSKAQTGKDLVPGLLWSHWQELILPSCHADNYTSLLGGHGWGWLTVALCFMSQGPLQFISSKHIQKKRNEEEGASKTESGVFVTIILKRFSW